MGGILRYFSLKLHQATGIEDSGGTKIYTLECENMTLNLWVKWHKSHDWIILIIPVTKYSWYKKIHDFRFIYIMPILSIVGQKHTILLILQYQTIGYKALLSIIFVKSVVVSFLTLLSVSLFLMWFLVLKKIIRTHQTVKTSTHSWKVYKKIFCWLPYHW